MPKDTSSELPPPKALAAKWPIRPPPVVNDLEKINATLKAQLEEMMNKVNAGGRKPGESRINATTRRVMAAQKRGERLKVSHTSFPFLLLSFASNNHPYAKVFSEISTEMLSELPEQDRVSLTTAPGRRWPSSLRPCLQYNVSNCEHGFTHQVSFSLLLSLHYSKTLLLF